MTTPDPTRPAPLHGRHAHRGPTPPGTCSAPRCATCSCCSRCSPCSASGLGALLAGTPGVWGAVIGVGLALLFSGTTIVSMLVTSHKPATTMAAVVMGAWLGKVVVLIAVLALLRGEDFYHRGVLAAVLVVGVVGSALLDLRAVGAAGCPT